ncbi:hypothetical protein PJ267_02350 [Arthrobacter sp. OVS8]|nr:hypothetical protein PJ267_02350 [Arthrobacter sp. OVS8]
MANDFATEQSALGTEVRHWRRASIALTDLEVLAAPAAWLSLESYLGLSIRSSLRSISTSVVAEADHLSAALAAARTAAELRAVRTGLLKLRQRYEQVETVLDFYGDAVNTRTNPRIGAVLRGLDAVAVDSMDRVLRPLGIPTPRSLPTWTRASALPSCDPAPGSGMPRYPRWPRSRSPGTTCGGPPRWSTKRATRWPT